MATWRKRYAPQSVTVCLEDEIDISRGDMLVKPSRMPHVSRRFEATVVWMPRSRCSSTAYLVKHTYAAGAGHYQPACIIASISTICRASSRSRLELNEIGVVSIETHRPLFFDSYRRNRATGALYPDRSGFELDGRCGNDRGASRSRGRALARPSSRAWNSSAAVSPPAERWERAGHRPVTIWLTARTEVAYLLERELFDRGCLVHVLADDVESHLLPGTGEDVQRGRPDHNLHALPPTGCRT